MEEFMPDDQLARDNYELEWQNHPTAIMEMQESTEIEEITEKTAAIVIDRGRKDISTNAELVQSVANITEVTANLAIDRGRKEEIEVATVTLFTNLKILENIILQVLYYYHPNLPIHFRNTVQQLRLVSKSFLQAVTQTLRQKKQTLFYLTLDRTNSLNNSPLVIEEFGKCLNNFVNWIYPDSFESRSWYKECRPLFGLKIMEEYFQAENHDSLLNCLLKCGEDLQKLEIFLLPRVSTFRCIFPPYQLPALEELLIHMGGPIAGTTVKYPNGSILLNHYDNMYPLISSLFSASSSSALKWLKLENIKANNYSGILNYPEFSMALPQSIVKLELNLKMIKSELEILLQNPFPNLTSLKVALPEGNSITDTVCNFINPFRSTLQELEIVEFEEFLNKGRKNKWNYPFPFPAIEFPKMERLKSLGFRGTNAKLPGNANQLSSNFPALENIHLAQLEAEFCKWTKYSVYEGVQSVVLKLFNVQDYNKTKKVCTPISLDIMQLLHNAFPNVTRLTLEMSDELRDGLQYLFREMRDLQFLKLCIVEPSVKNSDYWDALLTGITEERLKCVKESLDFKEDTVLVESNTASVCLLNELQELHLSATVGGSDASLENISLISDMAFIHGFCKMPKLHKLTLEGQFSASAEMCSAWKNQNCGNS